MGQDPSVELAETFAGIARTLLGAANIQETLQLIVDSAVEAIDGCDHAGVSIVERRSITTPAATDDVPATVDAIQYETNQGPCLDAIRDKEIFQTGDLGTEDRWPDFARRAKEETGITSMLAFRLFAASDTMGALNLYSKASNTFDQRAAAIGSVFAAHAAVALSTARTEAHLKTAVQGRDLIGQAKGILMAREGVTADEAFDQLREASQHLNRKLHDLAVEVTKTGEVPT